MARIRAHIQLNGPTQVAEFVSKVNAHSTDRQFFIENEDGKIRADARSLLGVIYASADFGDTMYLVNDINDGEFPAFIDTYRALA